MPANNCKILNIADALGCGCKQFTPITYGHCSAPKYRLLDQFGEQYFVRLDYPQSRFLLCEKLYSQGALIQEPLAYFGDMGSAAVFRWVEGNTVQSELREKDLKIYQHIEMGMLAAQCLKSIHNCPVETKYLQTDIKDEVDQNLSLINNNSIIFSHKEELCHYIKHNICRRKKVTNIHMDFHTQNMIVLPGLSSVKAIDCENLTISDPWRDFSYSILFHEPYEHLFWYSMILCYFNMKIPCDFWEHCVYYCSLQFIRMLIHEYKRAPGEAQIMADKVANSLYRRLCENNNGRPSWTQKYEVNQAKIIETMKLIGNFEG